MKTKELTVGKQYAAKRGKYSRPFKAICLSTTDKYVTIPSTINRYNSVGRPANTSLGERGGLPFAAEGYNREGKAVWVPVVLQPSAVFAQADDFDKALAAKKAKEEAEWQVRNAENNRQREEARLARVARTEHALRLNEELVARGLPTAIFDHWGPQDRVYVDVAFIEQVVRRLKVKAA